MTTTANDTPMFRVNDCPTEDCYFQQEMKACPYANAIETCPKVEKRSKEQGAPDKDL